MQHGVDDLRVARQYHGAARQGDHQRHTHHVARTLYEGGHQAIHVKPADQADNDGHHQKQGGDFIDEPVVLDHAHHHGQQGGQEDPQHGAVRARHAGKAVQVHRVFAAFFDVEQVGRTFFRVALDARRVPHQKHDADKRGDGPHDQPVAYARKDGNAGNALGDAHVEGIQKGGRKTHLRADEWYRYAGNRVVAQGQRQRHEDQDEGYCFLVHAEGGAAQRKHGEEDGDDGGAHEARTGVGLGDGLDQRVEGFRFLQHGEGAADDQYETYDQAGVDKALDGRHHQCRQSLWLVGDVMEGAGNDQVLAVDQL